VFAGYLKRNEQECQINREQRDARISHGDYSRLENDYEELRRLYVVRSDLDAGCWRLMHLLWIVAEVFALWSLTQHAPTAGEVTATLMYVNLLFEKAGCFTNFFNHLKQIEVADHVLSKE
jgi:hypothetical protein